FRANRFALKEANVFWLSDTPDVAGSNQWGGACIRVAAVVVLIDRTDGTSVGICNTHMDHISAVAREKGARLIRQRLPSYGSNLKWVVMGDFNARPGSVPYQALVGAEPGKITLIDTYAALHPKAGPEAGSFHGYTGKIGEGRIDWILASPEFTALAAAINQSKYRGMYPSDHFAAWADLKCTRAHLRQD
ncbi:endonuclease/exonuclease/phosphatase family protein, partial [Candidatus Sumerlaeota bacterium]|nr:endonuclease/exonuclease/phosphatase family protein [Candidatus Sumerlaeota bacterium]